MRMNYELFLYFSMEEGTATHSSILARISPWTERGALRSQELTQLKWLSMHDFRIFNDNNIYLFVYLSVY